MQHTCLTFDYIVFTSTGEWAKHWKVVHKEFFKAKFGADLQKYGYEENDDW
jgi:hypothetical protein